MELKDFQDKKVLVVGLAKSGLATTEFLVTKGARVTVTDHLPASELGSTVDHAEELGCTLALGGHPLEVFTQAELIIVSPGVPLDLPELAEARLRSIPVMGELELASRFLRLPLVAISGTNGKTTATALAGDMLKHSGKRVFVGGNIGNPLITLLKEASKCRLFANQTEEDTAVVPARDPLITVRCTIRSRQLNFSLSKNSAHAYLDSDWLMCRVMPGPLRRYDLRRWQLLGKHNQQNLLAAVLAATSMGANPEAIQETIDSFEPLPHRMELVHQWRGIRFYDDSKGTNVDSVVHSLESFSSPIILIAGGRDKEGSYDPLVNLVRQRAKMLVLLGEARFRLAEALGNLSCTVVVEDMDGAVQVALGAAVAGDVVLLSPACSSFDQYEDYQARGDHFRNLVHKYTAMEAGVDMVNSPWVSSTKDSGKFNAHN
ncbi:MAG: UDP-N-acetylmuramoyl-L-alanine--D-glutamate ligase [Deltaproteobacteria bacterium]